MKKLGLSNRQRLRHREEFSNVYAQRTRSGDQFLLIYAKPNHLGVTRIGLSVSRKHGNAVIRGKLKRWIREAFRLLQHELPEGLDLIIIPVNAEKASFKNYHKSLKKLVNKLSKRFQES
jgi:ribonuclease P protein component